MSTAGFSAFLARKNIKPSAKLYFVDAMSAMAMGLFASLLIGTILDTLGDQFHWDWLVTTAGYASSAMDFAPNLASLEKPTEKTTKTGVTAGKPSGVPTGKS